MPFLCLLIVFLVQGILGSHLKDPGWFEWNFLILKQEMTGISSASDKKCEYRSGSRRKFVLFPQSRPD